MIILGLDIATKTGWAVFDTDSRPSGIVSGSFRCEGKTAFQKVHGMRSKLPGILREYKPDFVAIEAPLSIIPRFTKKTSDLAGESETETTINAGTVTQLNRLHGAAQAIVEGFNIRCVEVAPRSWQSCIPKSIQGPPKQRVKQFCDLLNISGANADARDAAVIAFWCEGHCQEVKLLQRTAA